MRGSQKPLLNLLQVFVDDRGEFVPFIEQINVKAQKIKRVYHVHNPVKGTIRGFHYHKLEWKYFTIIQGSAKFIILNPEDPKNKYIFTLSSRMQSFLTVPPLFANGWVSLEDNTILLAASTLTTQESIKDDKRFDPYVWGDVWTVKPR